MGFILIYVTYPNIEEVKKASTHLLERKLIACSNYFPINAASCWTGKVAECDEVVCIFKTKRENWKKVKEEIKKIHSYKVPCIIKIEVEANEEYEKWVNESCQ
jgi:periplasmic divalent cation tolerance protein